MSAHRRNPAHQTPFDVAVAITGAAEDGLTAAIRSVFAQDCDARIQLLIGVEAAVSEIESLALLAPDHVTPCVFDPPGSLSSDGPGHLLAAMAYAANSRYIAFLDHRSRYARHHLRDLLSAAQMRNGAVARHAVLDDPDDPATLLIDKLHAPGAPAGLIASGGLGQVVRMLRAGRGLGETGRVSVLPATPQDAAFEARIDAYFAAHRQYRLLIGAAAPPPPGWLDCSLDTTQPLPFLDAVFEHVVLIHGLRPLPLGGGRQLLGECFRVLRPGGQLFVAERDLSLVLRLPASPEAPADRDHLAAIRAEAPPEAVFDPLAFAVNRLFADGSRPTVPDRSLLAALLHDAGFTAIRTAAPDILLRAGIDPLRCDESAPTLPFQTVVLSGTRPVLRATS